MKTTRNALFALLLLGSSAGAASAQASFSAGVQVGPRGHASVDFGFFYDSLASYGNWIQRPSYGWVWTPRDVSASWRPYQAGHWVWSDEGWTWLTDEPYGWATYHYGRWYQDPEIGWAWVPGNDWAPAWVSWQEGEDSVGWAPLPPGANVNASAASYDPSYNNGGGYGGGYDDGYGDNGGDGYDNGPGYQGGYDSGYSYNDGGYGYDGGYAYGGGYGGGYAYGIAPAAYLFVPTRYFLSVNLFDFFLPSIRVNAFFGRTRNCTYYGYSGGRYFNRGVAFDHVQRYYGRVPRYQLSELDGFHGRGYRVDGNRVAFYRPRVERGRGGSPLDRPRARGSVVDANRFRADHPDRQRNYAQTYGRINGRDNIGRNNSGRNYGQGYGQNNGRNYGQSYGQNYGQNNGRNYGRDGQQRSYRAPQVQGQGQGQRQYDNRSWQGQPNRQRSYGVPQVQGQGDRQRQYQAPRVQQQRQYQAPQSQQRQYQQRQSQQRQYQAPQSQQRQYQRPAERQRSYDAPRVQRQAPQQRENRGQSRGGQANRGGDNGRRRGHDGGK
jgi:hypothetical protein